MPISRRPIVTKYRDWPLVAHVYDGRTCPTCGALCCGEKARQAHRAEHAEVEYLKEAVRLLDAAVRQLAELVGARVKNAPEMLNEYDADEPAPVSGIVIGGGRTEEEPVYDDDEEYG